MILTEQILELIRNNAILNVRNSLYKIIKLKLISIICSIKELCAKETCGANIKLKTNMSVKIFRMITDTEKVYLYNFTVSENQGCILAKVLLLISHLSVYMPYAHGKRKILV